MMGKVWRSHVVRVLAYFLLVAALLAAFWMAFPAVRPLMEVLGGDGQAMQQFDQAISSQGSGYAGGESLLVYGLLSALAILATLVFGPPLAWTYMVTKRQEGYEQTFVQMLIMLPVVVAAVVRVVQGDLALAFALAGIVAAVRFRTTVKDLKNAVFAFASIGIGLASGTGNWMLAGLFSLIFCLVVYGLWTTDIGGVREMISSASRPMRLSEALVPGETHKSIVVGSREYARYLEGEELDGTIVHARHLARFVSADALKSKSKYDTMMVVYADNPEAVPGLLSEPLKRFTSRHSQMDILEGPNESVALIYLLRLEDEADVGEFLEALGCDEDGVIKAAELKAIGGLRSQIT